MSTADSPTDPLVAGIVVRALARCPADRDPGRPSACDDVRPSARDVRVAKFAQAAPSSTTT